MDSFTIARPTYKQWRAEILREEPFATFEHQERGDLGGGCVTLAYTRDGYFIGEYAEFGE